MTDFTDPVNISDQLKLHCEVDPKLKEDIVQAIWGWQNGIWQPLQSGGGLTYGNSCLTLKDTTQGNGEKEAQLFLIIQQNDDEIEPLVGTNKGLVVQKDIGAGGFISSNQGALRLGSGLNWQCDYPKIELMHSGTAILSHIDPLSSEPPAPVQKQLYKNTNDSHLYEYHVAGYDGPNAHWHDKGHTDNYAGTFDTLYLKKFASDDPAHLDVGNLTVHGNQTSTLATSGIISKCFSWLPSDISGAEINFQQGTSTSGAFLPTLTMRPKTSGMSGLWMTNAQAGEDSGAVPIAEIRASINSGAVSTRPLLTVTNNGTQLYNFLASGALAVNTGDPTVDKKAGIIWSTVNPDAYGIYRTAGPWSSPNYQQLRINWATGICISDGGLGYPYGVKLQPEGGYTECGGKLVLNSVWPTIPAYTEYRVNNSSGWQVGMGNNGDGYNFIWSYGAMGSATQRMNLSSSGKLVLVSSTGTSAGFEVRPSGYGSTGTFRVKNPGTNHDLEVGTLTNNAIRFLINTNNYMTLDTSGNLSVAGAFTLNSGCVLSNDTNDTLRIASGAHSGQGSSVTIGAQNSSCIHFISNGGLPFWFNNDIYTTGHFIFDANGGILSAWTSGGWQGGTPTYGIATNGDFYVNGNQVLAGGLQFNQGGTAAYIKWTNNHVLTVGADGTSPFQCTVGGVTNYLGAIDCGAVFCQVINPIGDSTTVSIDGSVFGATTIQLLVGAGQHTTNNVCVEGNLNPNHSNYYGIGAGSNYWQGIAAYTVYYHGLSQSLDSLNDLEIIKNYKTKKALHPQTGAEINVIDLTTIPQIQADPTPTDPELANFIDGSKILHLMIGGLKQSAQKHDEHSANEAVLLQRIEALGIEIDELKAKLSAA
jgi:hypothetical protein